MSVRTAPGRFEIATVDPSAAHVVATLAEEGWRTLTVPLNLPDAFSSPIFVRLLPETDAIGGSPFRTTVETGGIVTVWLPVSAISTAVSRRAIVQGMLMRLALTRYGVSDRLTAPLWLEHAAVAWWETRADAARLDALKQETSRLAAPALSAVLRWQRGATEPRELAVASLWLLTFLQTETTRAHEWAFLLPRLLGGDDPLTALSETFPGRFSDERDRELWWQTGYHQVRRVRNLPVLEPAESNAALAALVRFVFAGGADETDVIVPLRTVIARRTDPISVAEIARRRTELERLIPALHPFFRNAGLSLAEVFQPGAREAKRADAWCATFEQDWLDALELEFAAAAALDALEQRHRAGQR